MLNKNFKKFMLFVESAFFVGSLPFMAFCSGDLEKIDNQKKPFKNSDFSKIEICDKTIVFSPFWDSCYVKHFAKIESIMKDSPFVFHVGKDFAISGLRTYTLKSFMDYYGVIVFESGSIGPEGLFNILDIIGLSKDENDWKKEIFPLNDFCANVKEETFKKGYKLVVTNNRSHRKVIFNFEFGNVFTKKIMGEYDFELEIRRYNCILKNVLLLNPVSSNGLLPKKALKCDVEDFSVVEEVKNIKERSFSCSRMLVKVNFLGEIESLGDLAFSKCYNLKNVNFLKCVEHVGDKVFNECSRLNKIEFPQGLKSLGSSVFSNCVELECVVLPDSLEEICLDTFFYTPIDVIIIYKNRMFSKNSFLDFFMANGGKINKIN